MAKVERIFSFVDRELTFYGGYPLEVGSQSAEDGTPWLLISAGKTASIENLNFVSMQFDDVVDLRNALNDWITKHTAK